MEIALESRRGRVKLRGKYVFVVVSNSRMTHGDPGP